MAWPISIARRFNGPPDSGHGGYLSGLVARFVGPAAQVTLRRPPPLERPLRVERLADDAVCLRDGEAVVAEGAPAEVALRPPAIVGFARAAEAARSYRGFTDHLFPGCFGCGPERAEGDGLRIFAGPVPGTDLVAAPWVPDPSVADEAGRVRPEFVWAALDCPSGFALPLALRTPILLGRLAVSSLAPVTVGERCVVVGWPLGEEGRKLHAGSALLSEEGALRAVARSVWIRLA
jgi:hypothetical protein